MKSVYVAACLLSTAAHVRSDCDELQAISLPLKGDTVVTLSSSAMDCTILEDNTLQEFVIEGGMLTLTGSSTTKFTNMRFTVMEDAGLIFDFERTEFGPNEGYENEDDYGGYMVQVLEGGYAEFSGEMSGTGLRNYRSVFTNSGTMEFKSDARFYDTGSNIFRTNFGKLRFRGDAIFQDNIYLGIDNDGGDVRFVGRAVFNDTGYAFDGHHGGGFANFNDGTAIFDDIAIFENNRCDGSGGALYNRGSMKFYEKALFYGNRCVDGYGGAVYAADGDLEFFGKVQMVGNNAGDSGGGIAVRGGASVSFGGQTTIKENMARYNAGAMILMDDESTGSYVEFKKPSIVRISDNFKTSDEVVGCNEIDVEENSELVGYDTTGDICDES